MNISYEPYSPIDDTGAIGRYTITGANNEYNALVSLLNSYGYFVEEPTFLLNYGSIRVYDILEKNRLDQLFATLRGE